MGLPVQPTRHVQKKLWLGVTLGVGIICFALGMALGGPMHQPQQSDTRQLHEAYPSKHMKCNKMRTNWDLPSIALKDGTYADYWCAGTIKCVRGMNMKEMNCARGETYDGTACVEEEKDEEMCARCKSPDCNRVQNKYR